MTKIRIVDPHIHLWDLRTGFYPGLETPSAGFIGSNAAIARNYLADEYIAEAGDRFEITGAVHIEAFPTDPVGEVAHLQTVADAQDLQLGIVGYVDLSRPDLSSILDRQRQYTAFRGIRQVLNLHPDPGLTYVDTDFMADPAWQRGLRELCKRGLSFDLQLYPHQAEAAAAFARGNPDLPIILNHTGMWADRSPAGWAQWKSSLRLLATNDNVSVKISGLGMFDHTWSAPGIAPLVFETLDAFGTERSMFASNFPVDKLFSSYGAIWSAFDSLTAAFSEDEKDALFRGNAARIYCL